MLRRTFAALLATVFGLAALLIVNGTLASLVPVVHANSAQSPNACITIDSDVTTNTTWSAECYHIVTNTVEIQSGVVLTITPPLTGTRIEFETKARLSVAGTLLALGDPARPITFTSAAAQTRCAWQGIVVANNPQSLRLQYSTIEYACTGVTSNDADYLIIVSNTFRYLGDGGTFDSAIGSDTDNSTIANNTIYSSSNGIALNESSGNSILHNTIYDIDGYGIGLIRQTTTGGNNNIVGDNIIYRARNGLRLEDGSGNQALTNSLTLNTDGAIYLDRQGLTTVAYNHVYTNGGGAAYRGSIFITGTGSFPTVRHNVVLDSVSDTVAVDDGATINTSQYNALCATASNHYELRNNTGANADTPNNWWGTNTPLSGTNYIGQVTLNDPIVLSITLGTTRLPADASATTIVTVTLRDSLNNTVPGPNRSGDPNARRITLHASLGTVNPVTLDVNDQGIATATLTSLPVYGNGLITATAFCNYPITATYEVTATNVAITKTSFITQVAAGGLVTYTISYSNPSGLAAPNVLITDSLPSGLNYLSDNSGYTANMTTSRITWSIGPLSAGSVRSFVLTATVPLLGAVCGQTFTNTVAIGTTALESTYADNTAGASAFAVMCADWAIVKTAIQPSGPPNAPIDFTLVYTNRSAYLLSGAIITDQLPVNTIYVSDTSGLPIVISGSWLTWTLPPLPPTTSVSFKLRLSYSGLGNNISLTNTACISSGLFDSDPSNNCSSAAYLVQSQVDVVVIKDDDVGPSSLSAKAIGHKAAAYDRLTRQRRITAPSAHRAYVGPGNIVTYTIAVVNVSNYTATNFILTETLPLYMNYIDGGWTFLSGRTYTRSVGTLYPGDGRIVYFVTQVYTSVPSSVHNLINTICGFGSEYDLTPEDNCHVEDTPLTGTVTMNNLSYLPLIMNNQGPPILPYVSFTSLTYHVSEASPAAIISVKLDKSWTQSVTVDYRTEDRTATAGQDYTSTHGTLIFAPGQVITTFSVGIISDTLLEYWETVRLELSHPQNAGIGYPGVATLYIDDVPPCAVPSSTLISLYSPMDVAYDAPTDRLFIANRDGPLGGSLNTAIISPTPQITHTVTGLLSAQGVAQDNARHRLYVIGWNWLNVLNSDTYSVVATVALGSGVNAHAVAYNPNNSKIYVTGYGDNSITIIDANTLSIIARLTNSTAHPLLEPSYIALEPNTNKVYVTNHARGLPSGWVTVVEGFTNQIAKTIYPSPGGELYGAAVDPVHGHVYVAAINAAHIYVINAATDTQLGSFQVRRWSDNQPVPLRMIAVNPNPGLGTKIRVWLTSSSTENNGLDNVISLTGNWPNLESPALGAALPHSPERGIRFDPVNKYLFIASAASNRVTILRDTPETQQCLWPFVEPRGPTRVGDLPPGDLYVVVNQTNR